MSLKVLQDGGLNVLATIIKQIRTTADGNTSAVSDLGNDVQGLTERLADALQEVEDCLTELENAKADKAVYTQMTLAAANWAANTDEGMLSAGYAYAYDLAVAGVTAADSAEGIIQPGSITAAYDCGLCAISETGDGSIRYYAKAVPASDILMQVRIIQGLESDNE